MSRLSLAVCLASLAVAVAGCAFLPARPTPTPPVEERTVTGLVMLDESGGYIIGVNWPSRSRVTYQVTGGDTTPLKNFVGETVTVHGVVLDKSPFLKEMIIKRVDTNTYRPGGLSQRTGVIQRLGVSIYMQGSHKLLNEEGGLICLLSSRTAKINLDGYLGQQVRVTGTLAKTVEGNAWIMDVLLVEPVN